MSNIETAQLNLAQAEEAFKKAKMELKQARKEQADRVKAANAAAKAAAKQARKEEAALAKQWVAEQTALAKRRKLMAKVAKQAAKKALAKQAAAAKAVAQRVKAAKQAGKALAKQRKLITKAGKEAAKTAKQATAKRVKAARALTKQRKLITKAGKEAAKAARQATAKRVKAARALTKAAKKAAAFALKDRAQRLKAAKVLAKHRELMAATEFPSPKPSTKRKRVVFSGGRDQAAFNERMHQAKKMRVARAKMTWQRARAQELDMLAMQPVEEDDYSALMDLCECGAPADSYDHGQHCHTCVVEVASDAAAQAVVAEQVGKLSWNASLTDDQADFVWGNGFE